ncbi:MAG: hypothetical protein COU35_00625 [Candidatus Magasanikbacteria bacterium CG10_big_fil_rev_8_21_14_0_10_47_10]|uniref:Uncharacterized protein n=1 Tax=Candidatus Magasanikbacteria bacterium CG10_big_fil_rev_8_21_14_0_10_47_10 TaxID=1974652 RepID=A0A2H0TRJ4_9BACT|nr:MAG: hypothetical protein COU35_00625 [Candidatus Magasanikbacteria bacterium CG10_big_fil_rev_8_21_14_0_10_47_10]
MRTDRSLYLGIFVLGLAAGAAGTFWLHGSGGAVPDGVDGMASGRQVLFNQHIIEDVRSNEMALDDPLTVFGFVFSHLPPQVQVYPTENYYYFTFWANGQEIHGNMRLDAADRDEGLLSFGYFGQHGNPEQAHDLEATSQFRQLGSSDGVQVERLADLAYAVTYRGKRVVFALHDVPQTLPEGLPLAEGERFIARTFDESGWQLVLVYDEQQPAFRFLLDPTASKPDVLTPLADRIVVGRLSGFAFFEDSLRRHILFGVNIYNIRMNNYFDGPFDQLADNFVRSTTLQSALEAAYPTTRGHINARGVFVNEQGERENTRVAITPYAIYSSAVELQQFTSACRQQSDGIERELVRCLTYDDKQGRAQ